MKNALVIVVMLLCVTSAFAAEPTVSSSALDALGLGNMQLLSDADGMEVRGMSGADAFAMGASLGASQLIDIYQPGNFAIGTDTNSDRGSYEALESSVFSGTSASALAIGATNAGQGSGVENELTVDALIEGAVVIGAFNGAANIYAGANAAGGLAGGGVAAADIP